MLLIVKVEITQSDMQMKPPVDTFTCWPATIPLLPSNSDLINLGGSEVKASARNAGDLGSIPGLGRSPGERNGNPLQYSCLENPWMEEPGRLQSMGLQSRTLLSDVTVFLFLPF